MCSIDFGVDVGGTKTDVAAYDRNSGKLLGTRGFPTSGDFELDMRKIAGTILELGQEFGATIKRVGIAAPGRVNTQRTMILSAGNLKEWVGYNIVTSLRLREWLSQGVDIIVGNDAEGQALVEAKENPALHHEDFLLWAVGTGIGSARIVWHRGQPVSLPSEGAHARICYHDGRRPNPHPCGCGGHCTEAYGSGRAAVQLFGALASQLEEDEKASWVRYQALGLANLLTVHTVGTVVLGGGVALRDPVLLALLQRQLDSVAIDGMTALIVPSLLGESAGTRGALALLGLVA